MSKYVTRAAMEAESPGVYNVLPLQFRDRIPSEMWVSKQNTMIFRASFSVMPRLVDELFEKLRYTEGAQWPMGKLVAACYLDEVRIAPSSVRQAGERIYSTMPWPPEVRSIADALRSIEIAYFESHLRAPPAIVGGWRVESESPSRMVLADDTPYPCHVNEGVVAGICRAFAHQRPVYRLSQPNKAKREGGTVTRYEVTFKPLES